MTLLYTLIAVKADSTATRKYYRLEAIRVIAKEPQESIGSISVKSLNKENLALELNFHDTMKGVSGVAITSGSKGESNLRIRAFQKQDVKIMVDGRTLNGGYFGNVNLLEIPLFEVEEVQMVKGPVSSLYGFNSMGGAVNFITAKPSDKDWLKISSIFKRNNTRNSKMILSHNFKTWDFQLNLTQNTTDGFVLSKNFKPTVYENGDIRNLADNSSWDFQTKFNWTFLDYQSLGLTMGYTYADEKNVPNSIYNYENLYRKFSDWKRYNSSLLLSLIHTESLESQHRIYFDAFDNTYHEYRDAVLTQETLNSLLESYSLGYEGKLNMALFSNHSSALLLKSEKLYYNRIDNRTYIEEIDNATYTNSLSLFDIFKMNQQTEVSGGIGFSNSIRDISTEQISTPVYPDFCAGISMKDIYFDKVILGFSKNIQFPTMHELFSDSKGNLDLDAEKAYKTEFSLHKAFHLFKPLSFSNTFFYNSIHDMIELKGGKYTNFRQLENAGFETALMMNLSQKMNLELSYDYIDLSMNTGYPFYEIPENHVAAILNMSLPFNVKMKYQYDYYDDRISPDDNDVLHTLEAYSLHQINLSKSFKKTRLVFGVENILDTDYQEEWGFPASGINFTLGFETVLF